MSSILRSVAGAWLSFLLLPVLVAAQESTPPATALGELPPGVAYEPIGSGTVDDLLALSPLLFIQRVSFSGNASIGYGAYDRQEGPRLIFVETGSLTLSVPSDPTHGPVSYRPADGDMVVVTPNSHLELATGDAVFLPDDAEPGLLVRPSESEEPIVLYDLRVFPYYPGTSQHENFVGEALDLDLGIPTANPPAPAGISVGRLTMAPNASLRPNTTRTPMLFYIEAGKGQIAAGSREVVAELGSSSPLDPVTVIPPSGSRVISATDAAFVQAQTEATFTNIGTDSVEMLVIVIDPLAEQ